MNYMQMKCNLVNINLKSMWNASCSSLIEGDIEIANCSNNNDNNIVNRRPTKAGRGEVLVGWNVSLTMPASEAF